VAVAVEGENRPRFLDENPKKTVRKQGIDR
jgi:hypothetical protein